MKSGKTIDISKSSLISLKAELSRKQDEVKNIKTTNSYIKLPPKPKVPVKKNIGVEDRDKKDTELDIEEIDLLKKSKEVLAVKSKLYDELQKGNIVSDEKQNVYLVDFKNKETLDFPSCSNDLEPSQVTKCVHNDVEADDNSFDNEEIDDNEWVEYTDCLGRTRKCHRSDLAAMKAIDRKMAHEVGDRHTTVIEEEASRDRPPELVSSDMEREMFRKKWEEQEKELLKKKDIHYEDILFDEARAHGVGYFKFSQDEEKRQEEQEMLRKVREETEARQREARLLRERREAQRQSRLIAARQRQRARLGLPPLSEEEILKDITPSKVEEEKEVLIGPEPVEDLQSKLMRTAHVRPWDVGKDKVEEPAMTQEEWVEKRRNERKDEFAPMYNNQAPAQFDVTIPPPSLKKRKINEPPFVNDRKDEKMFTSSEEAIEAGLRFIRDQVEQQRSSSSY